MFVCLFVYLFRSSYQQPMMPQLTLGQRVRTSWMCTKGQLAKMWTSVKSKQILKHNKTQNDVLLPLCSWSCVGKTKTKLKKKLYKEEDKMQIGVYQYIALVNILNHTYGSISHTVLFLPAEKLSSTDMKYIYISE